MSGFRIRFNSGFFPERKKNCQILLKNLWTWGIHRAFVGEDVSEFHLVGPDDLAVIIVHRYHGFGWIWLPIFPFILLHESLHLIIAFFTPREFWVRYIPPFLDLFYLPIGFLLIFHEPTVTGLIIGDWIQLAWICLLLGNLKGDFSRMSKLVEESGKPEDD